MRDAVPLQQRKGGLGRKTPAPGHDRAAKIQRRQQRIEQAAGPGPIGGAPEHRLRGLAGVQRVEAKPVLAADKAAQVADQRPVRDQRALGVARGAAGVDQQRRVVGAGGHQRKIGVCRLLHRGPIDDVGVASAGQAQHVAQRRALGAHTLQHGAGAAVHQRHAGGAVLQPELQRLGAKQLRQRHRHRPQLQHRHVGHGGLETLRQRNRHPLARTHPEQPQAVGESVRRLLQLGVAVRARLALGPIGNHRRLAGALRLLGPAARASLGDIEKRRHLPVEIGVQGSVGVGAVRAGYIGRLAALCLSSTGLFAGLGVWPVRCLTPGHGRSPE